MILIRIITMILLLLSTIYYYYLNPTTGHQCKIFVTICHSFSFVEHLIAIVGNFKIKKSKAPHGGNDETNDKKHRQLAIS